MPREIRRHSPGAVVHVITRFVNKEFRMDHPGAREEYLRRVALTFAKFDWEPLGYALMSSHIHWALLSGDDALARMGKSLNSPFIAWLNRQQGRLGPGVANRPKTIHMGLDSLPILLAYIHNNPVRAKRVHSAVTSTWTSHRAIVGASAAPGWLDHARILSLCGYDSGGHASFDSFVQSRAGDPRNPALSGDDADDTIAEARQKLGRAAQVESAKALRVRDIYARHGAALHPRWSGDVRRLVAVAATLAGVPEQQVRGRSRARRVAYARRLVLVAGHRFLGRTVAELASAVGIAASSGSTLLHTKIDDQVIAAAKVTADMVTCP